MRTIPLTQGKVALVDDADYGWLSQYRWHFKKNPNRRTGYALRSIWGGGKATTIERMHRRILGLKRGDKRQTDHRDGNGLNNQRVNLRRCTKGQNQRSQRNQIGCTSTFKGVCWHRHSHKWRSYIQVNRKLIHLGYFNSEADAARAYDAAALEHHREFALTNKMLGLL